MIRWMTMELWAAGNLPERTLTLKVLEEMRTRADEYGAKWDSMKERLPPAMVDAVSRLRDAELLSVHADAARAEVRLTVRPWNAPPERWVFKGARRHEWINHQLALSGPPGFGHFGYSEFEVPPDGFSMAILFSSGLESVVRAADFGIEDVALPFGA